MRSPLNLDLLKDEERFSSSPIRLRVMLPLITNFVLLCSLVVWMFLVIRMRGQQNLLTDVENAVESVSPVHASVLASRDLEKETRAIIQQLNLYKHARNVLGPTLSNIAEHVPESVQFTEMRLLLPQPPSDIGRPGGPTAPTTNTTECVTLRIAGRTSGPHASESVNNLLAAFRTAAFTNVFRLVSIPKGAFRLDTSRGQSTNETLLFEITCDCAPRRFE